MAAMNFRLRYARGQLVVDADAELSSPFTVLIGESGAGKSTLVALLSGLLRPQEGEIRVGDRWLYQDTERCWIPSHDRRIGVVFQAPGLWPHLSVASQLGYGGRFREQEVIKRCGVRPLLERYPSSLSGGEKQRVALARAIMAKPEWLLLDEPVSALDESARREILAFLHEVAHGWGISMLYVSHHFQEVAGMTQAFMMMHEGRLTGPGPLADFLCDPEMVDRVDALGVEMVFELTVQDVSADEGISWAGEAAMRIMIPHAQWPIGTKIQAAFRPKDVVLSTREAPELSAQSVFKGTLGAIVPVGQRVLVQLDVGQPIYAEITVQALNRLGLRSGVDAWAYIKSSAIRTWRQQHVPLGPDLVSGSTPVPG
jgi:molybdate transport system ATP-binding protein